MRIKRVTTCKELRILLYTWQVINKLLFVLAKLWWEESEQKIFLLTFQFFFSYSFNCSSCSYVLLLSFYFVHKSMNVTFNHRVLKLFKCLSSLLYCELPGIEIILFTLYLAHNKFWEVILKHKNPTSYQKFSLSGIGKKKKKKRR